MVLPMLSVEQAWEAIMAVVAPAQPVELPLAGSLGSVLAADVQSTVDSPPFDKSMMDGYAVRVADINSAMPSLEVLEEVSAGRTPTRSVIPGGAIRVMTGAPVPLGTEAVVPVEWTSLSADGRKVHVLGERPVSRGFNILPRGQSLRQGETVLKSGTRIRAQEMALLAELGQARPLVRRPVRVAILATGDELVEVDQQPGPGQIRNSNALMLAAQVQQAGAEAVLLGIARDCRDDLRQKIQAGLECDLLCLSGGVSAGKLDLVPSELQAAGVREVFHKVSMKPGKPVWFGWRPGTAGSAPRYVFGLPGNPVSSMVCFELFVRTALRRGAGIEPACPVLQRARLSSPVVHRSDRPTYFPARVEIIDGGLWVQPVPWQGSADLRSTVDANCSVCIPSGDVEWEQGREVSILTWGRTLEQY